MLGASLLYWSAARGAAGALAWTVIAVEVAWGIPIDLYKMARGYKKPELIVWIAIHLLIAGTGLYVLADATS